MYNTKFFSKILIKWYYKNKREMPWRKTNDPYKIWLSEIMLQQTQVKTATPYYIKWIKNYPTIESVANSDLDNLLKIWEGLGYYNRCKNFYKSTKIIVKKFQSLLPKNVKEFKLLPGVGEYTASAVYSIVYKKPYPAIDGNVIRVMSRILGIKNLTNFNKNWIYNKLKIFIDKKKPGIFNQAMMELGSQICYPKKPLCIKCPISSYCKGFSLDRPESYPIKKKRKSIPLRKVLIGIIWKNNRFLIMKRDQYSHLANLWELPSGEIDIKKSQKTQLKHIMKKKFNIIISNISHIGEIKHNYSHFSLSLTGFSCKFINSQKPKINQPFKWIKTNEISKYAFPKANHKLFSIMDKN